MENALETYRSEKGLSFAELGRMSGFGTATVHKHCTGKIAIGGDAAIRYSRALGIPLDALYPATPPATAASTPPRRAPRAPRTSAEAQ